MDLETFRAQSNRVVSLARRDLRALWDRLPADPAAARDVLLEAIPALTEKYGELAALLAADLFERLEGRTAILVSGAARREIEDRVRFGVGPLWEGKGAQVLGFMAWITDQYVKQHGRNTMSVSSARAGLVLVRVPSGSDTCSWCRSLAGTSDERYHGDCDCVPVPLRD